MAREPRNPGFLSLQFLEDMRLAMKAEMDGNLSINLATAYTDDPDGQPGAFAEATFPGYSPAAAVATWSPILNDEGELLLVSPALAWTAGTIVTPESVVAVVISLDPAVAEIWGVCPLVDIWPVDTTGEALTGQVIYNVTLGIFTFMRTSD